MSYCRLSESDIYLYQSIGGGICCDFCPLNKRGPLATFDEAIAHVREHIAAGHEVPDWVIPDLEADRDRGVSLEPSS